MFELDGAAAVVTGAATGIGLAVARALAGQGARLTMLDRDADALAAHRLGPPHATVALDVTDHVAVRAAVADALAGGAPPILVNNAAMLNTEALLDLDAATWREVHEVNLHAAFVAIQAAAPAMRAAVAPGPVDTALIASLPEQAAERVLAQVPLGRYGRPEEVAAAVCFLASREAAWITGEVLDVNGGLLMD